MKNVQNFRASPKCQTIFFYTTLNTTREAKTTMQRKEIKLGEKKLCDYRSCTRQVCRYGLGFTFCNVHRPKMDELNRRAHVLGTPKLDDLMELEAKGSLHKVYAMLEDEISTRKQLGERLKPNARRFYTNTGHTKRIQWCPLNKNKIKEFLCNKHAIQVA